MKEVFHQVATQVYMKVVNQVIDINQEVIFCLRKEFGVRKYGGTKNTISKRTVGTKDSSESKGCC